MTRMYDMHPKRLSATSNDVRRGRQKTYLPIIMRINIIFLNKEKYANCLRSFWKNNKTLSELISDMLGVYTGNPKIYSNLN